jgi:hypothetical protein
MLFNGTVIIHKYIPARICGYHFLSLSVMAFIIFNGAVIIDGCMSSQYSSSATCNSGHRLWVWYMPSSTTADLVVHRTMDHRVVVDHNILVPVVCSECSSGQCLCIRKTPVTGVASRQYAVISRSSKAMRFVVVIYIVFVGPGGRLCREVYATQANSRSGERRLSCELAFERP